MQWQREKKSFHCPCQELNPGHPAHSLVTTLTQLLLKKEQKWIKNERKTGTGRETLKIL
jgi:hypothetical protein